MKNQCFPRDHLELLHDWYFISFALDFFTKYMQLSHPVIMYFIVKGKYYTCTMYVVHPAPISVGVQLMTLRHYNMNIIFGDAYSRQDIDVDICPRS